MVKGYHLRVLLSDTVGYGERGPEVLHTAGVSGSNPLAPTKHYKSITYRYKRRHCPAPLLLSVVQGDLKESLHFNLSFVRDPGCHSLVLRPAP